MPKVAECNVVTPTLSRVGNKVITNGTYFAQLHQGQKKGRRKKGPLFFFSRPLSRIFIQLDRLVQCFPYILIFELIVVC